MKSVLSTAYKTILSLFLILLYGGLVTQPTQAEHEKRILFIASYHPAFPTFFDQIEGLQAGFTGEHVELDVEFMDSKRFDNEVNLANFYALISYKLSQQAPYDLVVTADDNALRFVLDYRSDLFPETPIVFFGVNNVELALAQNDDPQITGVVEAVSMVDTLALMTHLTPGVQHVYAIVDKTPSGQGDLQTYHAAALNFPDVVFDQIDLRTLTFTDFATTLNTLPSDSAVLLLSAYYDQDGRFLSFADSLQLITQNLNVPLYHLWYHGMGDGVLGGKLISHYEQAQTAAQMAVQILHGVPVSRIPVLDESPNQYMFDYTQMKRFGIRQQDLPAGALIINEPETLYSRYKNIVWTVVAIMSMLVAFVISLSLMVVRQGRTERELSASNQQLAETLIKLQSTQKQLVQQERLAAVGQLSAGIAHDFNNILAAIMLYVELSQRAAKLPESVTQRLSVVMQQARRAANLVQQIVDFGRRTVIDPHPLAMGPFITNVVDLLQHTLPENVIIRLQHEVNDCMIKADQGRVQQAIVNMALNACHAMPTGGELTITLGKTCANKPILCSCCAHPPQGKWVFVSIRDTGAGIPSDALPHIFEPFFTTRAPLGSGLGLAQVYGIMKQHDGHIGVETNPDWGTLFTLYWPWAGDAETAVSIPTTPQLTTGTQETILVVEDDATMRQGIIDVLSLLNYEVMAAANGQEAVAIFNQHAHQIDLVLTDWIMPVMGGLELVKYLRKADKSIKIIVMTGHILDQETQDSMHDMIDEWLIKPLNAAQLGHTLTRVLSWDMSHMHESPASFHPQQ